MFSLSYFKQLLNKDKALTISLLLVLILNVVTTNVVVTSQLSLALTIILSYILPVLTFRYMHNQKAVDTYYSLPIKRSALLVTGLIYCILVAYSPYFISTMLIRILKPAAFIESNLNSITITFSFYKFVLMFFSVAGLVAFNTCIYLLGNNIVDGIILIIAYTALPLALYLGYVLFYETFVCGYYGIPSEYFEYLSPVSIAVEIFNDISILPYRFICIIYAILFSVLLVIYGTKKKAEYADKISNTLLSYPLIINLYLFVLIFCTTFSYGSINKYTDFLQEEIFYYLIIFVLYITFSFIYKRKFYFDIKMPIIMILMICISIVVSIKTYDTRAFGISESYKPYQNDTKYSLNIYKYDSADWDIKEWVESKINEKTTYIEVYIDAFDLNGLNQDVINKFEAIREKAIDEFYDNDKQYEDYGYMYLEVTEGYDPSEHTRNGIRTYQLRTVDCSIDTLIELAKNGANITLYTDLNQYSLNSDGNLIQIKIDYETTVYD